MNKKNVKDAAAAAKKIAEEATVTATKAAKTVSKGVKEAAQNASEMTAEVTAEAKKAVANKAATSRKLTETVYVQYAGKEINKDDLTKKVKEIWTKDFGKKVSEMKNVTLYIKPEDNKAYYVINSEVTGYIEL